METSAHENRIVTFPTHGIIGVGIILGAEVALFAGISLIGIYFTPIVWTGYILLVDGLYARLEGNSFIKTHTREFFLMLPWSVACWLVFEAYNLRLQNWTYVGLPEELAARLVGYIWSFATIFPAVLLTAKIIELRWPRNAGYAIRPPSKLTLGALVAIGTVMLGLPLLVSSETSSMMFALVWMGFMFLLDPINYLKGRSSIIGELVRGNSRTLVSLLLSGLVCGVLWEFWNYWAIAKWVYSVPIPFAGPKIFEMPLLGYLGFLPFAVECYVMNEFFYAMFPRLAQR